MSLSAEQKSDVRAPAFRVLDVAGAIVAAFSVAITLPLFDLLRRNAEFFVVRGSPTVDYYMFALGLAVVVPASLVTLAVAARPNMLRTALLYIITGILISLAALQAIRTLPLVGSFHAGLHLVLAGGIGVIGVVAMARRATVRRFLRLGLALPFLLLAFFLFTGPIASARASPLGPSDSTEIGKPVPIVMLVFDEIPVASLMRSDGSLNEERFPNFARLAALTTWFRNAYANSASTTQSVPSILTGQYPAADGSSLPILNHHPDNLFTLLEQRYSIFGTEPITRLCPEHVCSVEPAPSHVRWRSLLSDLRIIALHMFVPEPMTHNLPPIDHAWGFFEAENDREVGDLEQELDAEVLREEIRAALLTDRGRAFDDFVDLIEDRNQPALYFHHSLIPHRPWEYLPSGLRYPANPRVPGIQENTWLNMQWLVDQGYQRHLLQVGYADHLLGQLIDHLETEGLVEEVIIIVTSDHGANFRAQTPTRGPLENALGSVAAVPLFITVADESRGVIVDEPVELVDILPTIVDLLEADNAWTFDGESLQGPYRSRQEILTFPGPVIHTELENSFAPVIEELGEFVPQDGDWGRVFEAGIRPELIGLRVEDMTVADRTGWVMEIERLGMYARVDTGSGTLPALVEGNLIAEPRLGAAVDVAIAVNGTVSAVTRTFDQAKAAMISALLRPADFVEGANRLELFILKESDAGIVLRPLEIAPATTN